jgi:hypothetical protein
MNAMHIMCSFSHRTVMQPSTCASHRAEDDAHTPAPSFWTMVQLTGEGRMERQRGGARQRDCEGSGVTAPEDYVRTYRRI